MHHCLTKGELRQLIDAKENGDEIEDESLRAWVSNAECWMDDLSGLNYFLSQILEKKVNAGEDASRIIETFFDLENQMALTVQAFDARFVDFMLRRLRNKSLLLEDDLVELQDDVSSYRYGRTLRFRHHISNLSF